MGRNNFSLFIYGKTVGKSGKFAGNKKKRKKIKGGKVR